MSGWRTPLGYETLVGPEVGDRSIVRLDIESQTGFAEAVWRLVPMIERSLGPEILANRATRRTGVLQPWRHARDRFVDSIRRGLADRSCNVVIVTDVRDCYASIGLDAIEDALGRVSADRSAIEPVLAWCLRFRVVGISGLPVGPVPSAVLANAVLIAADTALREHGTPFLRWVDDIVGFASDGNQAGQIIHRLDRALAAVGLEINEAKTRVLRDRDEAHELLLNGRRSLARGPRMA